MALFLIYLFIINIISFLTMYIDKRRAIQNKWRISEYSLIMLSVLGGSIGSLFGMKIFRHKTKHIKFKYGIPIILLIQITLSFYIITKY